MDKDVDTEQAPPAATARILCGCGIPLGRFRPADGPAGELRLCPACDVSPPLVAA